jgi:uncharacterized protein YpmB
MSKTAKIILWIVGILVALGVIRVVIHLTFFTAFFEKTTATSERVDIVSQIDEEPSEIVQINTLIPLS